MMRRNPAWIGGALLLGAAILATLTAAGLMPTGLRSEASQPALPAALAGSWSGGGPPGAVTRAVAASPAYASDMTLFAATDGGLFRSTDGGAHWESVAEAPAGGDAVFRQVFLSPGYAADGTVFATLQDHQSGRAALYKSADRGQTWDVTWDAGGDVLAVSPAYAADHTVFLAGGDTLLKSTDGGGAWARCALAGADEGFLVSALAVSPDYAQDHTLYAAGLGALRRSTDGGATWQVVNARGPAYGLALSPAFGADGTLWYGYRSDQNADGSGHSGLRRSRDRGGSWSEAGSGLPGAYEPFPVALAVSPDYATDHTLFAALGGPLTAGLRHALYRSTDGGDSWSDLGTAPDNPDILGLAVSQGDTGLVVHLATGTGVWHYGGQSQNLIANGGFEDGTGWSFPATAHPSAYTTLRAHGGARSLRAGIESGADVFSYSDGSQQVTIPAGAAGARLSFYWWPQTAEVPLAAAPPGRQNAGIGKETAQRIADHDALRSALAGDGQYLLLLDSSGRILTTLLWARSNAQAWQYASYDLGQYVGQTVQVRFGVYNDGNGQTTALFVDDVALEVNRPAPSRPSVTPTATGNPSATPTPAATASTTPGASATPTASATAAPTVGPAVTRRAYLPALLAYGADEGPTGTQTPAPTPTLTPAPTCYEGLANGGFESDAAWSIRTNPAPAAYVTAPEPVFDGSRSLRTGISAAATNIESYSPVEQALTFPDLAAAGPARLEFAHQNVYGDGAALAPAAAILDLARLPRTESALAASSFAGDYFYVLAIHDDGTIDWLLVERQTDRAWRRTALALDASRYSGQRIRFQFGTYNNGTAGSSRTYIDNVALSICPTAR